MSGPRATGVVRRVLGFVLLFGLSACWDEVPIHSQRVLPGRVFLPGINQLVLQPVQGPDGDVIAAALASAIAQERAYGLVDNSDDRRSRQSLAQSTQPQALVKVRVFEHVLDDDMSFEEVDTEQLLCTHYTRHSHLRVQLQVQFESAHEQRLLDATRVAIDWRLPLEEAWVPGAASSDAISIQQWFAPRDLQQLYAAAYDALALQLAAQLAWQTEAVSVTLYNQRFAPRGQEALDAAARGDWMQAAHIYGHMLHHLTSHERSDTALMARLHYNLGVAWGMAGALAQGLEELQVAAIRENTPLVAAERARFGRWLQQATLQ